ncbi:M50 family metallopeptidase [Thalassotalea marina]|nr:M50 family metallopeptidase [Thalassotalea marina]
MVKSTNSSIQFHEKYRFWLLVITAALFMEIPFISVPFKWFETYFHEISHGIAAVVSGGEIVSIKLYFNGAGLCTTRGGSQFLTAFMGYTGASLWGLILYKLSGYQKYSATIVTIVLTLLMAISLLLWSRDPLTIFIIMSLIGILLLKLKFSHSFYLPWITQFISVVVLLNSVKSPLYLLDGRALGDGATLAQITFIPEIIWVVIWFIIGMISLYFLARQNKSSTFGGSHV